MCNTHSSFFFSVVIADLVAGEKNKAADKGRTGLPGLWAVSLAGIAENTEGDKCFILLHVRSVKDKTIDVL